MPSPEELGKQLLEAVKSAMSRSMAPVLKRVADLELRLASVAMVVSRGAPAKEAELRGFEDHLQVQRDLLGRLDAQAKRIELLESRKLGLHYAGIWRGGVEVDENSLATHSGSLWVSRCRTAAKPGTSDDWQLIAKRGS